MEAAERPERPREDSLQPLDVRLIQLAPFRDFAQVQGLRGRKINFPQASHISTAILTIFLPQFVPLFLPRSMADLLLPRARETKTRAARRGAVKATRARAARFSL